jgi:dTDP-4-dehydrorhamnose reductase
MSSHLSVSINQDLPKVFILGHKGMLGHILHKVLLSKGFRVEVSTIRYSGEIDDKLLMAVASSECTYIINAIGVIKQRSSDLAKLMLTNSILPKHLLLAMRSDQYLIHASTDCVFSGARGSYKLSDQPDPVDNYGLSKLLGECTYKDRRSVVVRSSIIGPEISTSYGLFAWFLLGPDDANGYCNHFWNGITTLEWSNKIIKIIESDHFPGGKIIHLSTERVHSKLEVLRLINNTWSLNKNIKSFVHSVMLDRSLEPTIVCSELSQQLGELKVFMSNNYLMETKLVS